MNSSEINLQQELEELFNILKTKGKIELNKLNPESCFKKNIIYINEFINTYINLNKLKMNNFLRNLNYLRFKHKGVYLDKYKTAYKKAIKKLILLIYLLIYRNQISTQNNRHIDSFKKYSIFKKLYNLLQIMSSIISILYKVKVINIEELEILLKLLIIFSMNNEYKSIKENNDIKNLMYFKECLNILFIVFNDKSDKNEQKFLIEIFNYINSNICFRDKNNTSINYTNKFYLLHNDNKTTKLVKLLNNIYEINNKDLTKIYFEFLNNIYYFNFSYNNLTWQLYELLQPLLENIKTKEYKKLLKEISFPEFHFDFINELFAKERNFINNNSFIFKNAFYFSGKQENAGIIAEIGKIKDKFLLAFGFNFIISEEEKDEYIIFQIKNNEQKVQIKVSIFKINEEYFLFIIDSNLKKIGECWKMKINPNNYYFFTLNVEKGKNITISYFKDNKYFEAKFKIKEIKTNNLLLSLGCEIEKIDKKSNLIINNYKFINKFSGFIGDIFLIDLHSYKEKFNLQKNILNLKGKYGYTLVKSLWEQKSLNEYITSNLEQTSKKLSETDDGPNYFKTKVSSKKQFKIIDNIEIYIDSSNFRLINYLDSIDYMNYDNKYHQKEKLLNKTKKENQYFNNLKSKELTCNNNKIILISSSLFNCHFNALDNTSGIIKFIEEDGIFYMLLILEYYYQVLFRICKDVFQTDNNNIILSEEQNEILKAIEKGIEKYIEFFLIRIIEVNFDIRPYKIILFYYQINVVIKQYILLKNITNDIYQMLLDYLNTYQDLLKEYIDTNYKENIMFYKNQRNFFLDFLLNPLLYQEGERFDLLTNLDLFCDSVFNIFQENILNDEILTENILEKLIYFVFVFNKSEPKEKESSEQNNPSFKKIQKKFLLILINVFNYIYLKSNKDPSIVKICSDKIFNYMDNINIFFNLSLALFISKLVQGLSNDFISKITYIFEENYDNSDNKSIIYSISSMLLLSSFYFIYNIKETEKIKQFKEWYLNLSQEIAFIYFEKIYTSIIGGVLEINDIIELFNNYKNEPKEKDYEEKNNFFDKKEKEIINFSINLFIQDNLYDTLVSLSGYENIIKKSEASLDRTEINEELQDISQSNKEKNIKLNREEAINKQNIKVNIKSNIAENELEIEKIKTKMNQEKYYNTYYCFLDDIKNRCFLYNPKNILIKRYFSHIFYKSFFNCKAFKLIKNKYLISFPEANVENKQLNYPSKVKNYSNIYHPKLFLRRDYNIYNKDYFTISHDFLTKKPPYEDIDEEKKIKIEALIRLNVFDINFYEHRYNINDILEEKDRYFDCELITQQYTYFGFIIIGNDYMYFGTKNEEPINLRDDSKDEININYISKYSFSNRDKENKGTKKKSIILFYHKIKSIIKRRSFLMYQSFEIFCKDGKNFFFNLYRKENCENAFKILDAIREALPDQDKFDFISENTSEEIKKINNEVKNGIISNYVYLLKLNYFASRTFNDLNQYPVFPWLFFDLDKVESLLSIEKNNLKYGEALIDNPNSDIDIEKNEAEKTDNMNLQKNNEHLFHELKLRNFSYPVSLQTEERRQVYIKEQYTPHGSHYSTSSYIYFYFLRAYPFLELMIQLQNLHKENPNRLFFSIKESLNILYNNSDNREICPEFFSMFDFYCNLNCSFLGIQDNGSLVDDLRVENGANISGSLFSTYFKYTYTFRKLLNSYLISKYLPNWIDYVFGIKQLEKTEKSFLFFDKVSYEDKLKLDKKLAKYINKYQNNEGMTNKEIRQKINLKIDFLNNFGITPHRVLNSSIKLKTSPKIKYLSDEILEINNNLCFIKSNNNILILLKNKKGNDKTKKILLWNYNNIINNKELEKNFLFPCGYMKQLQKITMINSSMKIPIFKPCYSMCQFTMFNKLFVLTCRYLGNIFKIQNSNYCIDVFCEDFVSCIACKAFFEHEDEDQIIYTGLKNGKFIEWNIKQNLNDYGKINITERNSLHCHKGEITCIEIFNSQKVLITGGKDKMIFIRKIYDYELLTAINLVYCYMNPIISQKNDIIPTLIKVSELNCIYILLYNFESGKSFIRGYNLNGLFFKQTEENYYMNICFTKNYNLLVSYYNKNKIDILNCYDLQYTTYSINLDNFDNNIEKKNNKKQKGKENNDSLVWTDYNYNNHELILLFEDRIVKGNISDKNEINNLEYLY